MILCNREAARKTRMQVKAERNVLCAFRPCRVKLEKLPKCNFPSLSHMNKTVHGKRLNLHPERRKMNSLGHAKPLNCLCFLLILLWFFQALHFIRSLSTTYCCRTKTTEDVSHGLAGNRVACLGEGGPKSSGPGAAVVTSHCQ